MDFFNSLLVRITLAVIGGIFYAFLTYLILIFLHFSHEVIIVSSVFVYLFYVSSRFLLLFSGVNSSYYSKKVKGSSQPSTEKNSFTLTAQWVGKFYHQHDFVLFIFLGILSIFFLITLGMDRLEGKPFGDTIYHLWDNLFLIP